MCLCAMMGPDCDGSASDARCRGGVNKTKGASSRPAIGRVSIIGPHTPFVHNQPAYAVATGNRSLEGDVGGSPVLFHTSGERTLLGRTDVDKDATRCQGACQNGPSESPTGKYIPFQNEWFLDPAACRGATPPSIPEKHEHEMRQVDRVDAWRLGTLGWILARLVPLLCRRSSAATSDRKWRVAVVVVAWQHVKG